MYKHRSDFIPGVNFEVACHVLLNLQNSRGNFVRCSISFAMSHVFTCIVERKVWRVDLWEKVGQCHLLSFPNTCFVNFLYRGTDMKFRLGFLKRRHTEGTINSSSVRPQPEEAQKWANSFSDLMASKCKLT